MPAPAVLLAKIMKTPDDISIFDLCFCTPNEDIMSEKGTHTLHLSAELMEKHLNSSEENILFRAD